MEKDLRIIFSAVKNNKEALPKNIILDGLDKGTAVKGKKVAFISVSDLENRALVFKGRGKDIREATCEALKKCADRFSKKKNPPRAVKFDVVTRFRPVSQENNICKPGTDPIVYKKNFDGLALDEHADVAILPEEVDANKVLRNSRLQKDGLIRALKRHHFEGKEVVLDLLEQAKELTLYKFRTKGYYVDETMACKLYRGHRMFYDLREQELKKELVKAIQWTKDYYFKNVVQESGRLIYSFLADENRAEKRYNILRHAGTTYAMWQVYEMMPDKELYSKAKAATEYLARQVKELEVGGEDTRVLAERETYKLGGNGLGLVALAKYSKVTGDKQYLPLMQKMARWIELSQSENGHFPYHKLSYPSGEPFDFECAYYPGEAMLGLLRLYELDKNPEWIDVAEKAADYIVSERSETGEVSVRHDHWLLYSFNELYRHRPKDEYIDHTLLIADSMEAVQVDEAEHPDLIGGYKGNFLKPIPKTPSANGSAFHGEGLCAAYKLVRDFYSAQRAEKIRKTVEKGIKFQLQHHLRPENAMYYKNQKLCLGGVRRSFRGHDILIDCVQHNISCFIEYIDGAPPEISKKESC